MEERQPVNHDFDPAVVQRVRRRQIHVLDSDIRGHTAACLVMTDFGQSVFGQSVLGHRVLPANFGQSVSAKISV